MKTNTPGAAAADLTAAAGGVAVTGAVILATRGWYWLDPAVALAVAMVIGYHAVALIWRVLVAIKTAATTQAAAGPRPDVPGLSAA